MDCLCSYHYVVPAGYGGVKKINKNNDLCALCGLMHTGCVCTIVCMRVCVVLCV